MKMTRGREMVCCPRVGSEKDSLIGILQIFHLWTFLLIPCALVFEGTSVAVILVAFKFDSHSVEHAAIPWAHSGRKGCGGGHICLPLRGWTVGCGQLEFLGLELPSVMHSVPAHSQTQPSTTPFFPSKSICGTLDGDKRDWKVQEFRDRKAWY